MKKLFQIILAIVILLLVTIHQALANSGKHVEIRNDKIGVKTKKCNTKKIPKNKTTLAQPDVVKEYITKRQMCPNMC